MMVQVNVMAGEIHKDVEIVTEDGTVGLRFNLLPLGSLTIWSPVDMRRLFRRALGLLDEHYLVDVKDRMYEEIILEKQRGVGKTYLTFHLSEACEKHLRASFGTMVYKQEGKIHHPKGHHGEILGVPYKVIRGQIEDFRLIRG